VGASDATSYLIQTNAGHILIDTGYEDSLAFLRSNIESLGFKMDEIKIILSGHAHFDHVGGHAAMKEATGAKVYASEGDTKILESGGTAGFHPVGSFKPVKIDGVLKDGDVVRLGNTSLTAHLTPGHTEGNTTWTTTVEENGKKYNVVFVASMSINPGVTLVDNPRWPAVAENYANSFRKLKSLRCDIFLGTHAAFFAMEEKVRRMEAQSKVNPFVDPKGYARYVARWEKLYNQQFKDETDRKRKN
jgi:metallo-beta-lactamase class B